MTERHCQRVSLRIRPTYALSECRRDFNCHLLVVIHALASVSSDGLPTPDYNDSLIGFDVDLIAALDRAGCSVLVETCGGRRLYYAYVASEDATKKIVSEISMTHGLGGSVSFRGGKDSEWKVYDRYIAQLDLRS